MNMQISSPKNDRTDRFRAQRCRAQRGYALLLIMFSLALLAATAMTVAPNILTEGRREKEQEMIWRGKQYTRAVRLYNAKLGHFPTSLDDLTKAKTGSIRFMRQAYKDPMNKEDGSWRLIYVGPAGQLIGSLKPPENPLPGTGGLGTSAAALAGASGQSPSLPGAGGFGSSSSSGFGSSNSSGFGSSSTSSFGSTNISGFGSASNSSSAYNSSGNNLLDSNGQPLDPALDPYLNPPVTDLPDTSNIVGGNIIGVGSKINQHSIKVYEKAKNYLLFEFVWNPAKDAAAALQQLNAPGTQGIGTPVGTTPGFGSTPTGPGAGAPTSGTPQSGTPPTSQPPNPPQQ